MFFSIYVLPLLFSSNFATANFTIPQGASCQEILSCVGSVTYNGSLWLTYAPETQSTETGMALYSQPVRMFDGSTTASFISTFIIEIHARSGADSPSSEPGDGMAFVMVADRTWVGSDGRSLGIYNNVAAQGTKTVAVEFDTYENTDLADLNNNHVGIDLNNATSRAARNASDLGVVLFSGEALWVWVEYDGVAQKMEVRLNKGPARPTDSFVQHSFNMSDVAADYMWVGFSGSNGILSVGYNTYHIYNWTFQTFGLASDLPTLTGSQSPAPSPSRGSSDLLVKVVFGVLVGALFTFLGLLAMLLLRLYLRLHLARRRRADVGLIVPDLVINQDVNLVGMKRARSFTYQELSQATGGFSEDFKLGQGGFGSVYRGVLHRVGKPDELIAVKRIGTQSQQGEREFMAEVSIISQVNQRNVLPLRGWSKETGTLLLVYELMSNGSLDRALFGKGNVLSWPQRFHIVKGIAKALQYLHSEVRQCQVIHRDVKSSNIMLNDQYDAVLGDFGLARVVDHQQNPATTLVLAGTRGYFAPEIPVTMKYTDKTDTYAFGVVALEVACGRKAFDLSEQFSLLIEWVWDCQTQNNLMSVVDTRLEGLFDEGQVKTVLSLGLLCAHPQSEQRPSMEEVIEVLDGRVPQPSVPDSKPVAHYSRHIPHDTYSSLGRNHEVPSVSSAASLYNAAANSPRQFPESEEQMLLTTESSS